MKRKTILRQGRRVAIAACTMLVGAATLQSCKDDDDVLTGQPDWLGNSIYEQLQQYGNYKTLLRLIDDVEDNREVLSQTGSRTLFATNDSAYEAWFQNTTWKTGSGSYVRSYEDLSDVQKKVLLNNSMLNNAYLIELMSNTPGNPVSEGRAMRRLSLSDIYDSVQVMTPAEMPDNEYWAELRAKGKTIRVFKDNTRAPLIHFLPAFMQRNGFTLDDLSRLTNRPATSLNDAWINGVKVTQADITCKNGYIHKVDGVIEASPNMAEIIHNAPNTTIWASMIDRYSAPFLKRATAAIRDGGETQLDKFKRLYHTDDSVYALKYFSRQMVGNAYINGTDDNGVTVLSSTDKNRGLLFDPGWNQYIYTNAANETMQFDAGAMIVPTDEAVRAWWNSEAMDLQNEYGSWENLPIATLTPIINGNMLANFVQFIPSKFDYVLNEAKQKLGIKPENIVHTYMGCNGVVYVVDKLFAPAEFSSVMYPATAHPSIMGLTRQAIEAYDFKPYLISMDQDYSVFLPTDKALHYYMDPAFYGSNRPQAIVFRYDEDTREISGDRYNVTVGDDGSITVNTGIGGRTKNNIDASVLEDRLRDLFDQLIVVGDVTDGHEFYKTKGGSIIRVQNASAGANGMTVQGAWQIAHGATIPVTNITQDDGKVVDAVVEKRNGRAFLLDSIAPLSAEPSVYQTLKKHAYDPTSTATQTADDDAYLSFYRLLNDDGCGLLIDKEGPQSNRRTVAGNDNKNIRLFSNYNYTVYVPTNESIQKLIDDGYLPTWEDYRAQTAAEWGNDEALADSAKGIVKDIIVNFLRYHIQDNSLMLGAKPETGLFETMMRDESTGRFMQVSVTQTGKSASEATLTLTDLQGNTRTVQKKQGLFNNICREYWFKSAGANGDELEIYFVSGAVVHQIDGPLLYQPLKKWRDILNNLKK